MYQNTTIDDKILNKTVLKFPHLLSVIDLPHTLLEHVSILK